MTMELLYVLILFRNKEKSALKVTYGRREGRKGKRELEILAYHSNAISYAGSGYNFKLSADFSGDAAIPTGKADRKYCESQNE